jgi:eukaryotic-like serine/threonine-protein kinase
MEPKTREELLVLIQKSGTADQRRLNAVLEQAAGNMPDDAKGLAALLVREGVLTGFQAEQLLEGKWRRFVIGKYRVLERIGSGGMSCVYLCEHKYMRRRAAVKVLPTSMAEDPGALERFYLEARAVAALDHPNIVRAYDVDQDDDLHYLVMEFIDGASLQELVRRDGPLEPARAADFMRQAALGLQHAHDTAGLVHRDIKPANLIVDRSGVVKILDLGLARFFHEENESITQKYDETVLGTADYLAPEQILDSHGVDIRADIYSLGATLYFCLAGKAPFAEGTIPQKLIWHQTRQPKAIRRLRPEVPAALEAVLTKMMAKDPGDRYQDPKELVEALAAFLPASPAEPAAAKAASPRAVATAGTGPTGKNGPGKPPASNPAQTTRTASLPGPRTPSPRRTKPARPDSDASSIETKEIYADADTVRPKRSRPKQKRPVIGKSRKVKLAIAGGVVAALAFLTLIVWIFKG